MNTGLILIGILLLITIINIGVNGYDSLSRSAKFHATVGEEDVRILKWIEENTPWNATIIVHYKDFPYWIEGITGRTAWHIGSESMYYYEARDNPLRALLNKEGVNLAEILSRYNIKAAVISKEYIDEVVRMFSSGHFSLAFETSKVFVLSSHPKSGSNVTYLWSDSNFSMGWLPTNVVLYKYDHIMILKRSAGRFPSVEKNLQVNARYLTIRWSGVHYESGEFAVGVRIHKDDPVKIVRSYNTNFEWRTDIIDLEKMLDTNNPEIFSIILFVNHNDEGNNELHVSFVGLSMYPLDVLE